LRELTKKELKKVLRMVVDDIQKMKKKTKKVMKKCEE